MRIRWAPKLPVAKLIRLYKADAAGLHDEELLADVGWRLYERCQGVVLASGSKVACPACGTEVNIPGFDRPPDSVAVCPCGWQTTAQEFRASVRHQDLLGMMAYKAFARFVARYPAAHGYRDRLLLVDQLIHATHVSGNTACRNLFEGRRPRLLVEELDAISASGTARGPRRVPGTSGTSAEILAAELRAQLEADQRH